MKASTHRSTHVGSNLIIIGLALALTVQENTAVSIPKNPCWTLALLGASYLVLWRIIIDMSMLMRHAERIKDQKVIMSPLVSAGQYWICFEMIADDGSLVIARVRSPRHPDARNVVGEDDEAYAIACEVMTMEFVSQRLPAIRVPRV